jgi:hypothetical protein
LNPCDGLHNLEGKLAMNEPHVYEAISTVRQLMKDWFDSASEREKEGWVGLLKITREDMHPRWDLDPEPYRSNPSFEEEMKFEEQVARNEKLLCKLREKEARFQEINAEINKMLPTICHHAYKNDIDPDPLLRLFELKQLAAYKKAVRTLWGIEEALAVGRNAGGGGSKRTGRPKKTEKGSDTKVVAALSAHHGYGERMSVTNNQPATNRGLAEAYKVGPNALSRFLAVKLGKEGHKQYEIACRRETIGNLLALWRGEMPGRLADLLPEEYGRGELD